MTNIRWTNKAVADLTEIYNYTIENWSESQADLYYQLLIESINEISLNPFIGKNYFEVFENLKGLKIGRHIIFYHELPEHIIEIVRILHEQMDLRKRISDK